MRITLFRGAKRGNRGPTINLKSGNRMVRLGLLWTISDLLVVTTGFSGSKSCRGVVRELPASSGAPFPDIFENVGREIWKSDGPFRAIMAVFGRSRRRGWTRAGRETLSALGRALGVVWGPRSIEVPRVEPRTTLQ